MKLAVIFGGQSTEHAVSVVSGISVLKNLDKTKYEIFPIYIDKKGKWKRLKDKIEELPNLEVGEEPINLEEIENPINYLNGMDCVFPVLHGLYGEDGTIQGLLELLQIPYVGCKVLASSVSMDKAYTKIIWSKANLAQVPYIYLRKVKEGYNYIDKNLNEKFLNNDDIVTLVGENLEYPVFIKPANSGSSVGITKAENSSELILGIDSASFFDEKILIEQGVNARELEVAVLGNDKVRATSPGEILSAEDFYSYDSKYKNKASKTIFLKGKIDKDFENKIKEMAIKAFKAVDGKGLARVDFFLDKETENLYVNEINTMPGFTKISMYPKLWENEGLKFKDLLDELIALAIESQRKSIDLKA